MSFIGKLAVTSLVTLLIVGVIVGIPYLLFSHKPPTFQECRAEHPDWSESTCKAVSNGKIQMGMSKAQVKASWGSPNDINTTVIEGVGSSEQWVYGTHYLYFDNGVLTSWQDT